MFICIAFSIAFAVDESEPTRFTANGNGTVLDNLTSLIWQQDGDASGMVSWADALNYCESLKLADYENWRLPNIRELSSIFNVYKAEGINSEYFLDNKTSQPGSMYSSDYKHPYWSSTTYPDNPTLSYVLKFGFEEGISTLLKTNVNGDGYSDGNYARCVKDRN